ncbi:MAG TPA: TonB-dependent receptor [Burkholderiaceae bacterium]|nr:TonB-dependent receptor [Burkholderiaceae bacterium]
MHACPVSRIKPLAAAAALAVLASAVHAQSTEPEKKADEAGTLSLDRIVITGTATARTKMKQSVSVSTLDTEQIQKSGAASAAEVLRSVPGIRSESSGGEGNANMTVRGAPISAGGSRYLQLQEDGLPVLLVGDVSFATADQFVRADGFLDSVQAVRGGSASTTATNSPAGIVNFISKTGRTPGGSAGLTVGLDHKQARLDFDLGGKLGDKTRYQIGGFQRIGEGPRATNITAEDGGQIRMNLTQEFTGGYVRVSFKHLDDKTPTYLPVPVRLVGNSIQQISGVDPRTAFFINSNLAQDRTFDRNGNAVVSNPADGLAVKNTSFGVELQADVGNGFTLTERLRKSNITGRFIGAFPAGSAPTDIANGADRYTGTTPVFSMHMFNTSLDDMGNLFSETRLAKTFDMGGGAKLTGTGGLFWGRQSIAETWYWNRYNVELKGEGARILDNAGNPTTLPVGNGTTTWGGCCVRSIDVDLTAVAPFAALTYDAGPLSLDASVRRDRQRASGWQMFDNAPGAGGAFTGWDQAGRTNVSYTTSSTSYSFGGNYEFSRAMAAFARFSKGSSWASPDRIIWDTAVATGSRPYPINELKQFEAGLKMRQGAFNGFFTFFNAKTKEDGGFEVTTRQYLKDSYTANGIEAEVSWRAGAFNVTGGATWTKAKIDGGANNGKTPRRQADFVYQLTPTYSLGAFEVGASIVGTTKSYAQNDNQVVLPGFVVVNPFASFQLSDKLALSLSINNLFDKLGYTEAEGQGNLTNNPLFIARSINGRTTKATLKYTF